MVEPFPPSVMMTIYDQLLNRFGRDFFLSGDHSFFFFLFCLLVQGVPIDHSLSFYICIYMILIGKTIQEHGVSTSGISFFFCFSVANAFYPEDLCYRDRRGSIKTPSDQY